MTTRLLYIVLATKLRALDHCCSLTAVTAALLIMLPLMRLFLPLLTFITTSPLVLFAMPRIQQCLFPLCVSSTSDDIILVLKNINLDIIDLMSEVEEFYYKGKVYIHY